MKLNNSGEEQTLEITMFTNLNYDSIAGMVALFLLVPHEGRRRVGVGMRKVGGGRDVEAATRITLFLPWWRWLQ